MEFQFLEVAWRHRQGTTQTRRSAFSRAIIQPNPTSPKLNSPKRPSAPSPMDIGGTAIAQKLSTAKQPDMPESAIASGCIDFILSPEDIAQEID